MFTLLCKRPLFVPYDTLHSDPVIAENHLIEMNEILGPFPEHLEAKWPRYNVYFGPNGERLTADRTDFEEAEADDMDEYEEEKWNERMTSLEESEIDYGRTRKRTKERTDDRLRRVRNRSDGRI